MKLKKDLDTVESRYYQMVDQVAMRGEDTHSTARDLLDKYTKQSIILKDYEQVILSQKEELKTQETLKNQIKEDLERFMLKFEEMN